MLCLDLTPKRIKSARRSVIERNPQYVVTGGQPARVAFQSPLQEMEQAH